MIVATMCLESLLPNKPLRGGTKVNMLPSRYARAHLNMLRPSSEVTKDLVSSNLLLSFGTTLGVSWSSFGPSRRACSKEVVSVSAFARDPFS